MRFSRFGRFGRYSPTGSQVNIDWDKGPFGVGLDTWVPLSRRDHGLCALMIMALVLDSTVRPGPRP